MKEKLTSGTEVITASGRRATIYKELPRAVADIRTATKEAEFDRTPYTVQYADGTFGWVLGGEIS